MFQLCFYEIKLNISTITVTFALFVLYIITIPLLIGFSRELLYQFHLSLIWMCILFAFLPERFFQSDLEDGTVELYFLSSCTLQTIFLFKLLCNWCCKISAILCSLPLLSMLYHFEHSYSIYITMILGSVVFTLICGIHSCFTLGLRSSSWNHLQHFTTLPTLLPFILLCVYIQTEQIHLLSLISYLSLFMCIYWVVISVLLHSIISR